MEQMEPRDTWEKFKSARSGRGIWKDGVPKLEKTLVQGLLPSCTTRGAHLNRRQHIEFFLHLVERDRMLHFHSPVISTCLFFDANNAHKGRKSQLISVALPEA